MATPPTIERPGVQVIQEFRTASPQILVPTMPACVMGPCFQVVEAVQDDGTLNPAAQITLPARLTFPFVGTVYTGIGGTTLELSVNNAAALAVIFAAAPANPTPVQVAAAINAALIPGIIALVEVSGLTSRVVIHTTAKGENASIAIGASTSAALLSPVFPATGFNLRKGYTVVGRLGYVNSFDLSPQLADYPDPRSNLADLDIDYETVRVFLNNGASIITEVMRTQTFLDGATSAVTVFNDGSGSNTSPYLDFAGANFKVSGGSITGTVAWTTLAYPADFSGLTLEVNVDGVPVIVTWAAPDSVSAATAIAKLNLDLATAFPGTTAVLNVGNFPVITSPTTGVNSSIEIGSAGTIIETTIGLAIGLFGGGKPGRARAQGITDLTAVVYATTVQGRALRMSLDGDYWQQITFAATVTSMATLLAALNSLWADGATVLATNNEANQLVLTSLLPFGGKESTIRIDKNVSDATLLTALGLTGVAAPFGAAASTGIASVYGRAYPPVVGDEVWVNGIFLGQIVEIVGTLSNRLRLSTRQLLTYTGSTWFVEAKGLTNDPATVSRPSSDLYVDPDSGSVKVKHDLFRDTAGVPTLAGPLATYLAYTALRKDVTPASESFNLLRIGSVTDLQTALSPIDTQNPLGLGMYFAILNAPGLEVTGCGVDETSETEPAGTLDGYTRSFEFIESKDVYAIAPLTHDGDVGAIAQIHVDAMSAPENGLERIALLNPSRPTHKSSTLVASGPLANVNAPPATNVVNTAVANLQALLAAVGLPGPAYTITDRLYIQFEDDLNHYPIASVLGGIVTLDPGPFVTGNDDGFFFDNLGVAVFSTAIVDRPFTVQVRGDLIANRTEEAIAYGEIPQGYRDRRVVVTAPSQAKTTLDGLETLVDGFYLAAALAGKISAKQPQQPLTEESIAGFTGVVGSQDRYSEAQLKMLSGGGLWVFYQEAEGQPIRTRHQLTSDMSTVQKRELSITTALDFAAKLIRSSLRNFIGRFNITTTVNDAITTTMEGIRNFLLRLGVFESFEVGAIRQNADDPTKLEIDINVGVFYPLNYISITLIV